MRAPAPRPAGNEGDATVAEPHEMFDRQAGAGDVVVGDAVGGVVGGLAVEYDHRNSCSRSGNHGVVDPGRGEYEAVDSQLQQAFDGPLFKNRVAIAGIEEHLVSELVCPVLDAGDHRAEERVAEIGNRDAKEACPALDKPASHQVGAVVECFDGLEDGSAAFRADPRFSAGDHRNQRLRHPGATSDIVNRRPALRRWRGRFSSW